MQIREFQNKYLIRAIVFPLLDLFIVHLVMILPKRVQRILFLSLFVSVFQVFRYIE